jgi:hypothetical protein
MTDEQIANAEEPIGYNPDYHKWPEGSWDDWRFHAYHIRHCASAMKAADKWVGSPAFLYKNGQVNGNHRLRAVGFLKRMLGIEIIVPVRFEEP